MNIMSKSKDQTEDTQPLSSEGKTEVKVQPSERSANSDNTQTSTQTSRKPLPDMLSDDHPGLTTVAITEKARQHAMLVRIALKVLLKAGLIKRYEVRSKDMTTVLRIRYEFDMFFWTEDLELK